MYLPNFEVFVISVKSQYDQVSGSNFVEDFGSEGFKRLKAQYENRMSRDEAVELFMHSSPRTICACDSTPQAF